MGLLAESRTRRKIQHDPNNTRWTRDTTTFGQKMLRSQGWEPGQFLGAKDSAHSEFHTAANASYIRVSLKDDMKGLGYSKSKEDEVTGLDVFSDLLSRLNGKSEAEVEEKQQARLQVKMHAYVEQKWGPMRFVRGGLLVGDVMEEESDKSKDNSDESESSSETDNKKSKSKKRKAESLKDDDEQSEDEEDEKKKKKKQRKEERKAKKLAKSESAESSDSEKAKKKEKKREKREKKEKKEKKKSKKDKALAEKETSEDAAESDDTVENPSSSNSSSEKVKSSKKDKKEKKEKKEKKDKDKKKKKKKDADTSDTEMPDAAPSVSRSGTATPISTGTSTPLSRNFSRARFIAQKRAAFADTQALKQIFMVKA
ncbi:uncharacterized protein TrAtP1_007927 [Trichoderma atroviride]|uniref:PinX1-related protein 1 n=1 Tax=Hypocrea atroviridis (strain ATCC 20476 / IMI 206040) TaxID=452589 RepID=G9NHE8_HYPAI|nr:uncharacterized protein TRIATDRAFT_133720 [Trichoderma atroviride IMI 206040]EHK50042.1 hypothetical protein TRIATDRAFT_133720 [Trichoderma atroviride IMI 206040]UKZ66756.1 hypothetical protein TrAtP1_007927 [Trichoderma atroviride]